MLNTIELIFTALQKTANQKAAAQNFAILYRCKNKMHTNAYIFALLKPTTGH